ncbi:MAG TPA: glycosyltransferase, partial [Pyrinomonadaceae bacterium]|nr:glycosyltransferase [Pyrinomonadaceae bacterium]
CPSSLEYLSSIASSATRRLIPHFESRGPGEIPYGPKRLDLIYPRIARLLNVGVRIANSRWIAFLDDDNEFEPNHLSSLVDCALRNDCSAVHSFRGVYTAEGAPYLEPRFPWTLDPKEASRIYELLCSKGVWVRNSHILKDRAGPSGFTPFRNSTILSSHDPVFLVDTSVWLLERSLLLRFPVPETFSEEDLLKNNAPDDKFLELLLENKIPIVSSGLPTLRYYLGGVSN